LKRSVFFRRKHPCILAFRLLCQLFRGSSSSVPSSTKQNLCVPREALLCRTSVQGAPWAILPFSSSDDSLCLMPAAALHARLCLPPCSGSFSPVASSPCVSLVIKRAGTLGCLFHLGRPHVPGEIRELPPFGPCRQAGPSPILSDRCASFFASLACAGTETFPLVWLFLHLNASCSPNVDWAFVAGKDLAAARF